MISEEREEKRGAKTLLWAFLASILIPRLLGNIALWTLLVDSVGIRHRSSKRCSKLCSRGEACRLGSARTHFEAVDDMTKFVDDFNFAQAPRPPILLPTNPPTDSPTVPAYFVGKPPCDGCTAVPPARGHRMYLAKP